MWQMARVVSDYLGLFVEKKEVWAYILEDDYVLKVALKMLNVKKARSDQYGNWLRLLLQIFSLNDDGGLA